MREFIINPNLPETKVKSIICGTDDKRILDFFEKENIQVISSAPNKSIDPSVSRHADMAALHLGGKRIIIDKAQLTLRDNLSSLGAEVVLTDKNVQGAYPGDVGLNFAVFGNFVVGNFSFADGSLIRNIYDKKKVNIRQGYAKCSILVVNKNAIITDDESIYRNVTKAGVDCLLISKGDIYLEGHEYGFIGGASCKISENTVVFFGNIRDHRDYAQIESFLKKYNCEFVCSDDGKLRDIGGVINFI